MKSWPRPLYQPGGRNADLFYMVFGAFELDGPLYQPTYRSRGLPEGCELRWSEPEQFLERFGEAGEAYSECIVLEGSVPDPKTLDYFRDTVGLVTYLLLHGGEAVFDLHAQVWWSTEEWLDEAFLVAAPEPANHVTLMNSESRVWTRGLRKFGRPDLSFHGPETEELLDLFERLIEAQGLGALFEEGEEVELDDSGETFSLHLRGGYEDTDFRNFYLELEPT